MKYVNLIILGLVLSTTAFAQPAAGAGAGGQEQCTTEFNGCMDDCRSEADPLAAGQCTSPTQCSYMPLTFADPIEAKNAQQACRYATTTCSNCARKCDRMKDSCTEAYTATRRSGSGETSAQAAGENAEFVNKGANTIDGKVNTEFTSNFATGTQVLGMAGQVSTNATTTVMGANAANRAMSGSSQSDQLKNAAEMTRVSGISQVSLGTMNTVAGGFLISRGLKHDKAAKDLESLQEEAENLRSQAAQRRQEASDAASMGNSARARAFAREASNYEAAAAKAAANVAKLQAKQREAAGKAQGAGAVALTTGLRDMIGGTTSLLAAGQMEKAAKNMKTGNGITAPGVSIGADPLAPKDGMVIAGNGDGPTASGVTADDTKTEGKDDLGAPLGNLPPDGGIAAPPAGDFVAKDISPGSGGGAPGGTSTSPGGGGTGDGDSGPKSAAGSQGSYESSGGGSASAGGGGRGGSADKGIDLASMLGQLLPKPEEEKQAQDILAFGNREPASTHDILGPDSKSLFRRAEEAVQGKFKAGLLR